MQRLGILLLRVSSDWSVNNRGDRGSRGGDVGLICWMGEVKDQNCPGRPVAVQLTYDAV